MALLEYHADPPRPGGPGFPYQSDLFRMRGETFAILRVDARQELPRPYWLTRDQVVALHALLGLVLTEWPVHELHPVDPADGLQSPPREGRDALAG
jgi:hypothetical protein